MTASPNYLLIKQKLARYCAYQERNKKEVEKKLATCHELTIAERQHMITELIEEGFLDEQRYIAAFVHDKFYLNKWGKKKICYSLQANGITDAHQIQQALSQIPTAEYQEAAAALASKKQVTLGNYPDAIQQQKVTSYLLQKGYELDTIQAIIH